MTQDSGHKDGADPNIDEDECVCGDSRQVHWNGDGGSMWNMYHAMMGREICTRFQLYKRHKTEGAAQ